METPCLFTCAVWPAVTSLVGPVYQSGLRQTDQHSHFDLLPFVWPIVSGKRGLQPRTTGAHAALFMQTLIPGILTAAV